MGRGSKPGERRGGRRKGAPNKSAIEAGLLAKRALELADKAKPLAREVLAEFMLIFRDLALANQRKRSFQIWARLAVDTAGKLIPFQSPRYAPISEPAPPPISAQRSGSNSGSTFSRNNSSR